jgi:SAM-dependent methyltransferase
METTLTRTQRFRRGSSRALKLAAMAADLASTRIAPASGVPSLAGDRDLEWTFCQARLADGPGRTLDFGADTGVLSLAAAHRGHDVVALDRLDVQGPVEHPRVRRVVADILDRPLAGERFDQVVNCSSVEHVGLAGRYDSTDAPDGDLEAMAVLADLLEPGGRHILTVPVGQDLVCAPQHRIYGERRLPRLLERYEVVEEQFWHKAGTAWRPTERAVALATGGSSSFYSLGLFVLRLA